MNKTGLTPPDRFEFLDILRGLASLSVVIWHYQHFFYEGDVLPPEFDRAVQPFYPLLWIFYEYGLNAVQLFFVISGFVFYLLYEKAIRDDKISATKFFILRFSRLYPLHFITLLMVAGLQYIFVLRNGGPFVYQFNDLFHFWLNIGFISQWGMQSGLSFNGPVWSVSVEILLYLLFFLSCRCRITSFVGTAILTLPGLVLSVATGHIGFSPVVCFFAGGLVFHLYLKLLRMSRGGFHRWTIGLFAALVAIVVLCFVLSNDDTRLSSHIVVQLILYAVFPLLVMCLVMADTLYPRLLTSLAFIGNLTYSTYLIHFPLQLIFVLADDLLGLDLHFTNPLVLLIFMGILIVISHYTWHFVERPAQKFIRQQYESARSKSASPEAE